MIEAASLGQLSTVKMLLDGGTSTVEDWDKVSVCVCVCIHLLRYFKAAIYGINCVDNTLLVRVHVMCVLVLVLAYC